MVSETIKKITLWYIIVTTIIATIILVSTIIVKEFILASTVGLAFNILVFVACYEFYKYGKSTILLITQYIQIIGVGINGFFLYIHANCFAGPSFFVNEDKIGFKFGFLLPEYSMIYVENVNIFLVSFNLLPLIIIYILKSKI